MKKIAVLEANRRPGTASSYYRSRMPLVKLLKEGSINLLMRPDYHHMRWNDLIVADVMYMQRPEGEDDYQFIRLCNDCGLKTWVDIDDLIWDIHPLNPASQFYTKERIEAVSYCIGAADFVTVSTQFLKEYILTKVCPTQKVEVIPNCLPKEKYTATQWNGGKNIVSRGSLSHLPDWLPILNDFGKLITDYPDCTFSFMGYCPESFLALPNVVYYKDMELNQYFTVLNKIQPSFVVAPLLDTDFNKAKSNIVVQEALAAGSLAFTKLINPDSTNDIIDFIGAIREMIKDSGEVIMNDNFLSMKANIIGKYYLDRAQSQRMNIIEQFKMGLA